jgi:hypothetical protein
MKVKCDYMGKRMKYFFRGYIKERNKRMVTKQTESHFKCGSVFKSFKKGNSTVGILTP